MAMSPWEHDRKELAMLYITGKLEEQRFIAAYRRLRHLELLSRRK